MVCTSCCFKWNMWCILFTKPALHTVSASVSQPGNTVRTPDLVWSLSSFPEEHSEHACLETAIKIPPVRRFLKTKSTKLLVDGRDRYFDLQELERGPIETRKVCKLHVFVQEERTSFLAVGNNMQRSMPSQISSNFLTERPFKYDQQSILLYALVFT